MSHLPHARHEPGPSAWIYLAEGVHCLLGALLQQADRYPVDLHPAAGLPSAAALPSAAVLPSVAGLPSAADLHRVGLPSAGERSPPSALRVTESHGGARIGGAHRIEDGGPLQSMQPSPDSIESKHHESTVIED